MSNSPEVTQKSRGRSQLRSPACVRCSSDSSSTPPCPSALGRRKVTQTRGTGADSGCQRRTGPEEAAGPAEQGPELSGAWPGSSGLRPTVQACPCCPNSKGLNFVLGSWLAVDCGWDRTSVCCYGCRTLEGDGWIIMANAAERVSGTQSGAGPRRRAAAGCRPSPGRVTVGPLPGLRSCRHGGESAGASEWAWPRGSWGP